MRRILPRVACGGDDPAAHIYPFDDLHITVVTFSTTIDVPVDEVYTEDRKKYCVGIVESRKRYGWEVRSNHCVEESTGSLQSMRRCLEKAEQERTNAIPFVFPTFQSRFNLQNRFLRQPVHSRRYKLMQLSSWWLRMYRVCTSFMTRHISYK